MKTSIYNLFARVVGITSVLILSSVFASAGTKAPPVLIKDVTGSATYSTDGVTWHELKKDTTLDHESTIKTANSSTVDFILDYSSTVLRLTPDSELQLTQLDRLPAGEVVITDTTLKLISGSILGSQRKLANPSRFKIVTADSVARIIGTEYLVRADGAVTVLSGEVTLNYNLPKAGGSVKATVGAGQSFDPASGAVVSTTSDYLKNIIADVNTVRSNAEVYKAGKATIVVKHKDPRVTKYDCDDDDKGGKGGKGNDKGRGRD
jgi:hypothetical protein